MNLKKLVLGSDLAQDRKKCGSFGERKRKSQKHLEKNNNNKETLETKAKIFLLNFVYYVVHK